MNKQFIQNYYKSSFCILFNCVCLTWPLNASKIFAHGFELVHKHIDMNLFLFQLKLSYLKSYNITQKKYFAFFAFEASNLHLHSSKLF